MAPAYCRLLGSLTCCAESGCAARGRSCSCGVLGRRLFGYPSQVENMSVQRAFGALRLRYVDHGNVIGSAVTERD
jgi:hypothetical protein